jgi:DNA-binding NarL/FixJ family response regulator
MYLGAAGVVNKPVKKEVLLPAITRIISGERI